MDHILAREKQLSVERTADILIQVGEALMEAHAIGYVHRDLRPRNIYLANRRGRTNFVKLLDFGLAKLVENDASAASTSLGMTFGDPRYMSPEQARGDRIDRRADIYQLGCVAYEMLTGAPPFSGNRVFDILTKQVTETPVPVPTKRPGVPLWMEAAVAKMLAKDPENRFATTTRMVEALKRGLETGEVMDDSIARRRESVPPPSVSRVMQKMGISQASDEPVHKPEASKADAPLTREQASSTTKGLPPAPKQPDSVELLRKRTGTPRVGTPVVPPVPEVPKVDEQPPVAGEIQKKAEPRGKSQPSQEMGISQVWYDEGDRGELEDSIAPAKAKPRSKKLTPSPSSTDVSLYDELPQRSRVPYIIAAFGLLVVGGVAFALTRNGDKKPTEEPKPAPIASTVTADAAPSTFVAPETPDAAPVAEIKKDTPPPTPKDKDKPTSSVKNTTPKATTPKNTTPKNTAVKEKPATSFEDFVMGGKKDPANTTGTAPPKDTTGTTTTTGTSPTTTTGTTTTGTSPTTTTGTTPAPPKDNTKPLNEGPKDPYDDGSEPPSDGASTPEKKAEFFANLGTQQLANGDTANAAASFRKALDIDGRNVPATIGLGEVALRQGLFGDAIAHLKKAARLAPTSSRVFTLLGEAYLNSGNTKDALTQFKKALQLDPDNARAREGFNEAQSRSQPTEE
jgi:serine/threonine protein kinase